MHKKPSIEDFKKMSPSEKLALLQCLDLKRELDGAEKELFQEMVRMQQDEDKNKFNENLKNEFGKP